MGVLMFALCIETRPSQTRAIFQTRRNGALCARARARTHFSCLCMGAQRLPAVHRHGAALFDDRSRKVPFFPLHSAASC